MFQNFKQHVKNNFPFLSESRLLVAVSGGIDSVVLSHLIHQLHYEFAICHCNFQLRGEESDDDEKFVIELTEKLKTNIHTTRFATEKYARENKLSIQVAARNLRYTWFYELINEYKYDYVLTAHNTNDNLETFLINFTRGTGLEGLTGIPPINEKSIRPLLNFSRDDITMYAIKNNIVWREDRSNANVKYIRNKVRHQILPVLKEINPHILDTFKKTTQYLSESQIFIKNQVDHISEKIVSYHNDFIQIDLKKLNVLEDKKAYLYQVLHPYGFTEWNDVIHLTSAQSSKQVFSKTHRLIKDRNSLILTVIGNHHDTNQKFKIEEKDKQTQSPIPLKFEKTKLDIAPNRNSIIVDKDLLKYPLSVRKWSHGDYICPTGMKGSKKLSQLFKDKKLSLIDKEKIWLLSDAEDSIIWVVGMRQDRRFTAHSSCQNKLKISCIL